MGLERDHLTPFADQLGKESREDPVMGADVRAGPPWPDEPCNRRLELRLVRPVALSEPSEN
jgi:hypothetical protein